MRVVVPFDARDPNTRLDPVLDADERRSFARAMLADVLAALRGADRDLDVRVLATAPVGVESDIDADVTVDDRPLTPAVNAALAATEEPVAVVMADLPLVTPEAVEGLLDPEPHGADDPGEAAGVVLAPGLGGGTNAVLARHPGFRVDYHGVSYRDHREAAAEVGATVRTVDSFRLALDVDDPADLAEVLLHSEGEAAAWLREAGFAISTGDGRMRVERG
jgi:2-phospho-L-lactate guanylyltransferase